MSKGDSKNKPIVTAKAVPSSYNFDYGTMEFFIDGKSIGQFDGWEEDTSAGAVTEIFETLHDLGIVVFDKSW